VPTSSFRIRLRTVQTLADVLYTSIRLKTSLVVLVWVVLATANAHEAPLRACPWILNLHIHYTPK
jgi:hypothetical protein